MYEENLSAVLYKSHDIRLEQKPVEKAGENQVIVAVHSVGICGSDIHFWTGDWTVPRPMVLGHESSGTVVEVGEGVTHLKRGDRVTLEPCISCRCCDFCKSGRYNLCLKKRYSGSPSRDGTLTRYYRTAADVCYKLPDHVSLEEGALLEPLGVAVHACRRAGVTIGSTVLVCGSGPIGLVSLMTTKAMGASKVCVTDLYENRLRKAQELGADHVILLKAEDSPKETASRVVSAMGQMPNITMECVGVEASVQTAVYATKSGGVVALVGLGPAEIKFPVVNAAVREVDIRTNMQSTNSFPTALSLVSTGQVDIKALISHELKLEDTVQAFRTATTPAENAIKIIIHCNST